MCENEFHGGDDEQVSAPSIFKRLCANVGNRWPMLQFWSFGFYNAWILLVVSSNEAVAFASPQNPNDLLSLLYLSSGIALSICLILAGFFCNSLLPLIEKGPLPLAMGTIASLSTLFIMNGVWVEGGAIIFVLLGVATGCGTAVVCLRVGFVTSGLDGAKAFFVVCSTALLSYTIFFVCRALPTPAALVFVAALPILSAVVSYFNPESGLGRRDAKDLIDVRSLPRGYFTRLIIIVAVFAVAAGVMKGLAASISPVHSSIDDQSASWIVLASSMAIIMLITIAVSLFTFRNFEISRVYIPIGFLMVLSMLTCSAFGVFSSIQNILVNVLYNVFILMIWLLLVDLAGRTSLNPVRIFGFGRGASGAGTTLGWGIAILLQEKFFEMPGFYTAFFVIFAIAIVFAFVFVINERTISEALGKTMGKRDILIKPVGDNKYAQNDGPANDSVVDAWTLACDSIAAAGNLTARESEVLALLSRGRSIGYIAEEFGIAYNTVKGYTKNVYAKVGTHSRQELIDLVELRAKTYKSQFHS